MRIAFPELVQFKAPAGLTAQLSSIAERERLSVSALVRRFVVQQLEHSHETKDQQSDEMTAYDGPHGLVTA
jgi:hypothetical protein